MTLFQMVERERGRQRRLWVAAALLGCAAVGAILFAAGIVLFGSGRWIGLPALAPILVALLTTLVVGGAGFWLWRRASSQTSRASVATAIEGERSLRRGALVGALELGQQNPLAAMASNALATTLKRVDGSLAPRASGRTLKFAGAGALTALFAAGAVLIARRAYPDGWQVMSSPVGAMRGTLLPPLALNDLPSSVLRGERVRFTIAAMGRPTVTVHTRVTGAGWTTVSYPVRQGVATVTSDPIDADLEVYAADSRGESPRTVVHVTEVPFVGDLSLRAIFPGYLSRAPEPIPVGEPVQLPQGTQLEIRGRASTGLQSVALVDGSDRLALSPSGHTFSGSFAVVRSAQWNWEASSTSGRISELPPPIDITMVPDSAPTVDIPLPQGDTVLAQSGMFMLQVEAIDDHGIASVSLLSWKEGPNGTREKVVAQELGAKPGMRYSAPTQIDLTARGIEPGDYLHITAVATDESPWRQTGSSRELIVRIPSLTEQRLIARQAAESAVAGVAAAAAAQKQLEQKTSEAARARGDRSDKSEGSNNGEEQGEGSKSEETRSKNSSFEAAEKAKALAGEQRELQKRVQELRQTAKDLEEKLKQAGGMDSALSARMKEVQQLLKDALTPAMQKQLEAVDEAVKNLSPEDARQALANLAEQQKRMREQLDRSLEALKRAALEGSMETLHQEAKDIAQKEKNLSEKGGGDAAQQKQMQARTDSLVREIDKMMDRLQEQGAKSGVNKSKEARDAAQRSGKQLRNEKGGKEGEQQGSEEQGKEGGQQGKDASQRMKNASQEMQKAADQLANARSSQIQEWKDGLTSELDQSIQEMMQLAQRQQELEKRASGGESANSWRSEQSAVQQGAQKSSERLQQAARTSSLVSQRSQQAVADAKKKAEQISKMAQSPFYQNRGDPSQAASMMREATEAFNQAAASLVRDRDRAANASSASGFAEMLEQLKELAKQQGQLNGQSNALAMNRGNQQGQAEMLRQLAQQQRQIASALQDVADADGSGRSEALAKEAKQLADALSRQRSVDPATVERQQKLFRRMLDAGRTLEQDEREESDKREATSPKVGETFTPQNKDARGASAMKFREPTWNELRGLTAEERRLIIEYFKRINARQK
jgi:hypothetical protein